MKANFGEMIMVGIVCLTVHPLPATGDGDILAFKSYSDSVDLTFATATGTEYQVQWNANLLTRFWQDCNPRINGQQEGTTNATISVSSTHAFFRVLPFTNSTFWYDWRYYYQNLLPEWSLGTNETGYATVDRPYEWYIDQALTGTYANDNCGPASATMALKWYDELFDKTAEDARNTYMTNGGWWYSDDIINYLDLHSASNSTSEFTGTNQLVQLLDEGHLAILCINTAYLTANYADPEARTDRFYTYSSGHFAVLKGWRNLSSGLWFEVYDPNNWKMVYADNTQKGKNRHYAAGQLANAISEWWNYLIVVHPAADGGGEPPDGGGGGVLMIPDSRSWLKPVDPARIPHMPGR